MTRDTLIVGDVQGDVDRLQEALEPYPEDDVDTVFLGDFFQGGELGAGGGAAAAKLAMRRRNARSVLGNHDLFLLVMLERSRGGDELGAWRTRDGLSIEDLWLSRRGDWADLDAVASDAELEETIQGIAKEKGFSSGKDVGLLMKELMARHRGRADGKRAQEIARKLLP